MPDVFTYPGQEVDVTWDRRLCIHVGECTRARGAIFEKDRKPWGDPDRAGADEVAEVVARCPTGALAVARRDGDAGEPAQERATVTAADRGPLFVRGDLSIEGAADDMPGVRRRAALCRCGRSSRKPFCDGSHEAAGFSDHGAVGTGGTPQEDGEVRAGPLAVTPSPNGPLLVSGPFTLVSGSGRPASRLGRAALCRCGGSSNKPFCDGTHTRIGFRA